jgi:FtsH ternary system domain X6
MKAVSRFEYNLLRILQFFLKRLPLEQVRSVVVNKFDHKAEKDPPQCISRPAVELVQDALAKGCVELLARGSPEAPGRWGGWRRERFLRANRPVDGRLWERTPPRDLGLPFSRHALGFLIWITAVKPAEVKKPWDAPPAELTVGDGVLLLWAYEALRPPEIVGPLLRSWPVFRRHPLCRLAFPEDFAEARDGPPLDFAPWTTGLGACILEALQGWLVERCLDVEQRKGKIADWQKMRALGQTQEQAFKALLDAAGSAHRLDLLRFLLRVAWALLSDGVTPARWIGALRAVGPRMADRVETHQAALALVRQLDRLKQWEREARTQGYFEEGYARGQFWLADWEYFEGDVLHRRAQALVQQLDPLKQA